jgi:FlaA1/EpsC-like NDP-sugar epimerase
MDKHLPEKWKNVPLQSSVDEVPDYATLFDTTLVLTIVFSLFELAAELLRFESVDEVVALVAATAVWAVVTCGAEVFVSSALLRFYILLSAGFIANILMLLSHIMYEPLGLALYSLDCLGKCAVVMLALQVHSKR